MNSSEFPTLQELKDHEVFGKVLSPNKFNTKKENIKKWNRIIKHKDRICFEIAGEFVICQTFITSRGLLIPQYHELLSYNDILILDMSKTELLNAFIDVMKIDAAILENSKEIAIIEGENNIKRALDMIMRTESREATYLTNNHQVLYNFKSNLSFLSQMGFAKKSNKHLIFRHSEKCFKAQKLKDVIIFDINNSPKYIYVQDVCGWSDLFFVTDSVDIASFLDFYGNNSIVILEMDKEMVNGYSYVNINSKSSYSNLTKNLKEDKAYIGIAFDLAFYYNIDSILSSYFKYENDFIATRRNLISMLRKSIYGKKSIAKS